MKNIFIYSCYELPLTGGKKSGDSLFLGLLVRNDKFKMSFKECSSSLEREKHLIFTRFFYRSSFCSSTKNITNSNVKIFSLTPDYPVGSIPEKKPPFKALEKVFKKTM